MEKAREFFLNSVDKDVVVKEPVILRLLESLNIDMDKLKRAEAHLPPDDGECRLNIIHPNHHNLKSFIFTR